MKHKNSLLLLLSFALFFAPLAEAQSLRRMDSVTVSQNGFPLDYPFVGGLNLPQFSTCDFDQNGVDDLVVFDRAGGKLLTFLNGGTSGMEDYAYAPEYQADFPDSMDHFALMADFNCDGKADIFTASTSGLRVYRNTGTASGLSFVIEHDTLMTDRGAGKTLLAVLDSDIPAFVDVEGDGDMDILTFDPSGSFVEWHRNNSVENTGNCANMDMVLAQSCWGYFQESGVGADITLGITCRLPGPDYVADNLNSVHAGSTIAAFDEEGDGDLELVLGDLITNDLVYLRNGGSALVADMDSTGGNFPAYDSPVKLDIFAAAYFLDVNNDGKKDMVAAPNAPNIAANVQNSWYYQNIDPGNGVFLTQSTTRFLSKNMIDVGSGAFPAFFDHNNDGLMDFVVGNTNRKISVNNVSIGVALYENVGTATQPAFAWVTDDYAGLSSVFGTSVFGLVPAMGDLDGDGDDDMVIGESDGRLHYFENIAPSGQDANFVLAQANYKGIDVGNFSTPNLIDIDRDGKLDLVVGETAGNLNYYLNTGTAQAADFSSTPTDAMWGGVDTDINCCTGYSVPFVYENPSTNRYDLCVGSEKGNILYFEDIESQLGGNFALTSNEFGGLREGDRTAVAAVDLNQDNKLEWLVGNLRGGLSLYEVDPSSAVGPNPIHLLNSIDLFPNPSRGVLKLKANLAGSKQIQVEVFDLQGRLLARQTGSSQQEMQIQTTDWESGLYMLSIQMDGQYIGSKKWILER